MTVDLDALEAKLAAATPGEWEMFRYQDGGRQGCGVRATSPQYGRARIFSEDGIFPPDASLIAAARNALPELLRLARVGQAVEEVAEAEEDMHRLGRETMRAPRHELLAARTRHEWATARLRNLVAATRAEAGR